MQGINEFMQKDQSFDRTHIERLTKQNGDLQHELQQTRNTLRTERQNLQKKTQEELHRVKD